MCHRQHLRRLGLSWRCTYAAVQYTDRLFSKIHLTRRSYQLTAAAAIAVAAKVEEAFDEIPSLSMILMADEVCISFKAASGFLSFLLSITVPKL